MNVTGKVAIVTGGGRGIGRGIARVLASNGADIVIGDLNLEEARSVAREVGIVGRRSIAVSLDVTDPAAIDQMVEDAIAQLGQIDILVNNAGVIAAPGWEQRQTSNEDDWDITYEVNVKGIAKVTYAVAKHMKTRCYGKIVNIASIAGRQGYPGNPPYGVSKAGVISLTQAVALELAPYAINVNAICPGLLWTPMWERISYRSSVSHDNPQGLTPRQLFEQAVEARIPLNREQTPEDIGNLTAFLASDYAQNITGQAINVSGGSNMN